MPLLLFWPGPALHGLPRENKIFLLSRERHDDESENKTLNNAGLSQLL